MLSSSNYKSRSALSEATANKKTPNAPNGKLPNAGSTKSNSSSPSSLQKSRTAVDQLRRSAESKPAVVRHSSKTNIISDKQRVLKTAVSLSQLDVVQELTKAVEQLSLVEIERSRLSEELKDAKQSADEANAKLLEALSAKKKAEECCGIEKFRADEIEQASIIALQKKEEEGQKELDIIRKQYSSDVAALNSVSQELKAVKEELEEANNAKNTALRHVDYAMKNAEVNAEKVKVLSAEVNCLKDMLDSKMESVNNEAAELVRKLNSEVDVLKHDLERAKAAENNKLVEMEVLIENLRTEASDANSREFDARIIASEWKKKVELLEDELEESNEAHMAASNSLALAMREMEENNSSLRDAQFKIGVLHDKVASLEDEVARKRADLEESEQCLDAVKLEALERGREVEALRAGLGAMEIEVARMRADLEESDLCLDMVKKKLLGREEEVEALRSQLRTMEEEKMQGMSKDKNAIADIEFLKEEKDRLMIELEVSRDEAEKTKKAMEDLASALHEVSLEARETRESLLTRQVKADNADAEIEELKTALKNMEEKCEVMLDEAKYENVCLRKAVERMETEAEMLREEWGSKEYNFINAIKKSEEEVSILISEMTGLVDLLKEAQDESYNAKEEKPLSVDQFTDANIKERRSHDVLEEVKAEVLKLKGRLLTKENEIRSINQMNDDLKIELSSTVGNAKAKITKKNDVMSPETFYAPCDSEDGEGVKSNSPEEDRLSVKENGNGYSIDEEPVEVELMDISSELDHESESVNEDQVLKIDSSTFEKINIASESLENGSSSPSRQKKKKALLLKIGGYLRKKSNQK